MFTLKALVESIYSPSFYRKVNNQGGIGFNFISLTSLLGAILVTITVYTALTVTHKQEIDNFIAQIPKVTVKSGELSIDKPSPYHIRMGDEGFIIFDTSMKHEQMNITELLKWMEDNKVFAVITKTAVVAKKSNGEIRVIDLKDNKEDFTFDANDARNFKEAAQVYILPVILFFVFLGGVIYKLIQMFLFSLPGMLVNKMVSSYLDYNTIQRVTTYTIWPATLLVLIFGIANQEFPTFAFIAIVICYQFFAFKSIKNG